MLYIINYWAVLVCAIFSMILGFIWYGPLFGKNWARLIGVRTPQEMTPEENKDFGKKMIPVYITSFVLSGVSAFVLALLVGQFLVVGALEGIKIALLVFVGFVVPLEAGVLMWGGRSRKDSWEMFWITSGYQLVFFVFCGALLGMWI